MAESSAVARQGLSCGLGATVLAHAVAGAVASVEVALMEAVSVVLPGKDSNALKRLIQFVVAASP